MNISTQTEEEENISNEISFFFSAQQLLAMYTVGLWTTFLLMYFFL